MLTECIILIMTLPLLVVMETMPTSATQGAIIPIEITEPISILPHHSGKLFNFSVKITGIFGSCYFLLAISIIPNSYHKESELKHAKYLKRYLEKSKCSMSAIIVLISFPLNYFSFFTKWFKYDCVPHPM